MRTTAAGVSTTLFAAVLAAALGGTPAALWSAAEEPRCDALAPPDLREICDRGELRVVRYGGERPPFFTRQAERWVGFDVDLGRDIAERLGVAYREDATAASFDEVVERVAAGDADLAISKLSATLGRAQRVRFTRPYLTVYQAVMVNRLSAPAGGDPFRELDAPEFEIGALDGSAYVGYARRSFPNARVTPHRDFAAMMTLLVDGGLDAVLMDSARANAWRRGNRQQLIRVRTHVDKSRRDPLAMAVGWRHTHLLAWLNLYLERIEADGTAERLYRRWFLDDAPSVPGEEEAR